MESNNMVYRYLGNSGLQVSVISWGNWINTAKEDITYDTVKYAYDNGVNFFDTAEIYGFGEGEKSLGYALKKLDAPRESLVISTKIFKVGFGVNQGFLSRKHIIEGLNNSLKRLQLDYVDVVFCHRFDSRTPLEETCRAMDWVINQGKAFYWGTSEWTADQIMEAHLICEKYSLIKPIVDQCQYNMMVRDKVEKEYVHLFDKIKLGTTTWSPLMSGVLTGKYIDGIPEGSRFDTFVESAKIHYDTYMKNKEEWDSKLKQLKAIAERLQITLTQLVLIWVIKNPDVSTMIVGSSRLEQFKENIDCVKFMHKVDSEVEIEIEKILNNAPENLLDWRYFKRQANRRHQNLKIEMN